MICLKYHVELFLFLMYNEVFMFFIDFVGFGFAFRHMQVDSLLLILMMMFILQHIFMFVC